MTRGASWSVALILIAGVACARTTAAQPASAATPQAPLSSGDHRIEGDISPENHRDIPKPVARVLVRMGCTITQFADTPGQDGVVRGALRAAGSRDLAVLCRQKDVHTVIVFWGERPTAMDAVAKVAYDAQRSIGLAKPAYIIQHLVWYGTSADTGAMRDTLARRAKYMPLVTHDGVEVGMGCCSSVHFWSGKAWVMYPGAD